MKWLTICLVIASTFAIACDARSGTAWKDAPNQWSVQFDVIDKRGVAFATFADTLNSTGWGVFNVNSSSAAVDADQLYGAGYLEGALTAQRIWENAQSMRAYFWKGGAVPAAVSKWFATQDAWTTAQIAANPSSLLWQHVGLVMQQFNGLVAGYAAVTPASQPLSKFDFQMLQATGDLLDLLTAIKPEEERPQWDQMTPEEVYANVYSKSLCSAIVKVTGDYSDLFASHSSWFTYSAMNRIYKNYAFALKTPTAANKVSFSSYPGFLVSLDDFYMMDSQLVMIQTTNQVFDNTLYNLCQPQSLFAWQRVRIANQMAHTGEEWYKIVSQYNSGTYNNQYMVINYPLFKPGQPLVDGLLWVIEQIPGQVVGRDVTNELRRGYFPSYNVPYFVEVYNKSGYPAIVAQYGTDYSYELAPRAKIFRRDSDTVVDFGTLKQLMRYNDYTKDPYSKGNAGNAICSRGDLVTPSPYYGGCYDTKVTQYNMVPSMTSHAINGPTFQNQPVFEWTDKLSNIAHYGQPKTFDFDFQVMKPQWP